MTTYEFTLIVEGADLQAPNAVDALHEAGCDDGTVGVASGVQYLDFDREAPSFVDAVLSAKQAIEAAVPGARVVQLEPDDLVTMAEIAARTGRTRESVRLLISGERGPGGFPAPATHFKSRHRMWRWSQVATWFLSALAEPVDDLDDPGHHQLVTAINAALALDATQQSLAEHDRRRIRRLVS